MTDPKTLAEYQAAIQEAVAKREAIASDLNRINYGNGLLEAPNRAFSVGGLLRILSGDADDNVDAFSRWHGYPAYDEQQAVVNSLTEQYKQAQIDEANRLASAIAEKQYASSTPAVKQAATEGYMSEATPFFRWKGTPFLPFNIFNSGSNEDDYLANMRKIAARNGVSIDEVVAQQQAEAQQIPVEQSQATSAAQTVANLAGNADTTVAKTSSAPTPQTEKPQSYGSVVHTPELERETYPQISAPVEVSGDVYGMPELGARGTYIPDGDFTHGAVTINPINSWQDNGGLSHAAMNALYTPTNAAPSLGEMLAFGSIMQGGSGMSGGIGAVTKTMMDADRMHAYANQAAVAEEVQRLMSEGRSFDEARFEALSDYALHNGQSRQALGVTMPDYAKYADERAGREIDATFAAGGDYTARGAFGYTPLGIGGFTQNGDAMDINIGGKWAHNVPKEYAAASIYGALKGNAPGAKTAGTHFTKSIEKGEKNALAAKQAEVVAAMYAAGLGKKGTGLSLQEKIAYEEAKHRLKLDGQLKVLEAKNNATGNSTGPNFGQKF